MGWDIALVGDGCVTDEGTTVWSGEDVLATLEEATTITYGLSVAGDFGYRGHELGRQALNLATGELLTDVDLDYNNENSTGITLEYVGWTVDYRAWQAWRSGSAATVAASGTLVSPVAHDTFSGALALSHAGSCAAEPDGGTLVLVGTLATLTYTFDGTTACDGQVPWSDGYFTGTTDAP